MSAKSIEIELGGSVFVARLLEERAPKTCAALWEALPVSGRAVHAMLSGDMFRLLESVPLDSPDEECESGFQYPGEVVYYPPLGEIAICYGTARFRGVAHAEYVTPIAEIEGEIGPLATRAKKLQWDGATPLSIRRAAADVAIPARASTGRRFEVRLGDAVATATFLDATAPRTCAAIAAMLPLSGAATNTTWSGAVTRLWGPLGEEGKLGLKIEPAEAPTQFHWPGYLYYHISWDGIRICYGDGQQSGAFSVSHMTPFARFEGDWSAFRETAANLYLTGSKQMSLRML
ncbi:MAG: DUF3830 family protein [Chloroflexota bacterium]